MQIVGLFYLCPRPSREIDYQSISFPFTLGATLRLRVTDSANRLISDDNFVYSYDANGNLVAKTPQAGVNLPAWSYVYDALDQLIQASKDGTLVESYRYDAFGRRTLITGTDTTAIINDGMDRTIDLAGAADIQSRYTHSDQVDEPLLMEVFDPGSGAGASSVPTDILTYHTDHLGSVRYMTDESGNLANFYDYDSYGRPTVMAETTPQPFMYTAREWDDALGLYQYRARQYDPDTGRFMQEDPIGLIIRIPSEALIEVETTFREGNIGQSQSYFALGAYPNLNISLYRYVENNPTNFVDFSGQTPASTYSKWVKKQSMTIRSIDFHARRALKTLPEKAGKTYDPRNGHFFGSAAKQQAKRKRAIEATQKCIEDSLSSPTSETLSGAFAALMFCGLVGVLEGATYKGF